jgi:hypothetical protein
VESDAKRVHRGDDNKHQVAQVVGIWEDDLECSLPGSLSPQVLGPWEDLPIIREGGQVAVQAGVQVLGKTSRIVPSRRYFVTGICRLVFPKRECCCWYFHLAYRCSSLRACLTGAGESARYDMR